jgi:hypothetical protein
MSVARFLLVVVLVTIAVSHAAKTDVKRRSGLSVLRDLKNGMYNGTNVSLSTLVGTFTENGSQHLSKIFVDFVYSLLCRATTCFEFVSSVVEAMSEAADNEEDEYQHTGQVWRYGQRGWNWTFGQGICKKWYHFGSFFSFWGKETWTDVGYCFFAFLPQLSKLVFGELVFAWFCVCSYRLCPSRAQIYCVWKWAAWPETAKEEIRWSAFSVNAIVVLLSMNHFLVHMKYWNAWGYVYARVHAPLTSGDQIILQKNSDCTCQYLLLWHWGPFVWPMICLASVMICLSCARFWCWLKSFF